MTEKINMNLQKHYSILFLLLILSLLGGCAKSPDQRKLNILLIGDSISRGYAPFLRENLTEYNIHRPEENCRGTTFTLQNVEKWLAQFPHDIIIWNNGNWNMTTQTHLGSNTTDEVYKTELLMIETILIKTGAKVFFVETTDSIPGDIGFEYQRELNFNRIAHDYLKVPIIPLWGVGSNNHVSSTDIHYNQNGEKDQAAFIADYIKTHNQGIQYETPKDF